MISLIAGVVAVVAIFDAIGGNRSQITSQKLQRIEGRYDTCEVLKGAPVVHDGRVIGHLDFNVPPCSVWAREPDLALSLRARRDRAGSRS